MTDEDLEFYFEGAQALIDKYNADMNEESEIEVEIEPLRTKVNVNNRGKIEILFNKPMNFPANLPDLITNRQRKSTINGRRSLINDGDILDVKVIKSGEQKNENV
jgi:hypothetical protein